MPASSTNSNHTFNKSKKSANLKKRYALYFNSILFFTVLAILGILFFASPLFGKRPQISESEKRKLAQMPTLSAENFFSGKYLDSIDLYFADNFPFREHFVALAFEIKQNRGFRSDEVGFYGGEIVLNPELEEDLKAEADSLLEAQKSTETLPVLSLSDSESTEVAENEEVIAQESEVTRSHGLLIYNGMAIQLFGGTEKTAQTFIEAANAYYEKLGDKVQVYSLIVPIHAEFYLPDNYRKHSRSESKNISYIYSKLNENIHTVSAIEEMRPHKDEYLYFNTDHHWTGLGAYYAYRAFCKSAKLNALSLDSLQRKVIPNFLGSLYRMTRDNRLKEKGDSVVYYKIPYTTTAEAFSATNLVKGRKCSLYSELYAKGANAYGVFLGADFPMMRIDSPQVRTGRRALILKNSYGNPFATYLPAHFEQVFVIDYRYFKGSVSQLVEQYEITDVILFNVSSLANTTSHARLLKKIL